MTGLTRMRAQRGAARRAARRARARALAALVFTAAAALVLSACAGLPTSGPVFPGLPPGAVAPPDFSFVPQKPQDGASPEQIVQGFIDAGISPEGNWAVAQLYLAPDARDEWKPNEYTTIDDRSQRAYVTDGDTVQLTVTQEATVDATGAYKPSDGGTSTLPFTLAKVSGQWRITKAPAGVVLGADQFTGVYREYPLMYFDPTWHYLVPDVRWFPSTNAATRVASALVDGKPSPWLAGAVISAFPDTVALDRPSVPVSAGGVAQVELRGPVLSVPSQALNRMQTQLDASLAGVGAVGVDMVYAGTTLSTHAVPTSSTRIDARALVDTEKGFGFIAGSGDLQDLGGISTGVVAAHPAAVELAADYSAAAVRTTSGHVVRVPAQGDTATLDTRGGLVDPAVDVHGFIWSVPASSPEKLLAFSPHGQSTALEGGGWSNASAVTALSVSRDGTRMAALLTVGGQPIVAVFGIQRNADGVPHQLGEALQVANLAGTGIDLSWIDDSTVAVLARTSDGMTEIHQVVGGPGVTTPAPDDALTVSGSSGTTVRLRGADGTLYSQRGSNWEQAGSGIRVLATVQGMPQQG